MKNSISLISGPQVIGINLNWCLLGALNVQTYVYYNNFATDHKALKAMVYAILAFEWVNTGLITSNSFDCFVYRYGDVECLLEFHNSWFSIPFMCAIVSAVVQGFFVWRIYILAKSRLLAVTIASLSVIQCTAGIALSIVMKPMKSIEHWTGSVLIPLCIWLAGSALADIMIALAMTILLHKSRTGIMRTDAIINRMILLGVETGSVTAVLAVVGLLFATVPPINGTVLYSTFSIMLTKVYANTLLVNLNSRLRSRTQIAVSQPIMLTDFIPATDTSGDTNVTACGSIVGSTLPDVTSQKRCGFDRTSGHDQASTKPGLIA